MNSYPKKVHFTGIKGVGMTATALCYQDLGAKISGSDVADEFVTDEILSLRNIKVTNGFAGENIPEGTSLLIYTGAHNGGLNAEVIEAKKRDIKVISQAEAVGKLMEDKFGISVGGVGGKTTTSAMIAAVLAANDKHPSFLIGVGEIKGLGLPGRYDAKGEYFVAEADEYVVSPGVDMTPRFMFQTPKILVITNLAYDHPDVYESFEETKKAFLGMVEKLPEDGIIVINGDDNGLIDLTANSNKSVVSFGESELSTTRLMGIDKVDDKLLVSYEYEGAAGKLRLNLPGKYNALNALACLTVCKELGLDDSGIGKGLEQFGGTKRRFERIGKREGILFFDDYAHHPKEIEALLSGAKDWLPDNRIVVVFQPHTYSRTKVLLGEFAKSFSKADEVIITDIFASAREETDETVSGEILAKQVANYHPNAVYVSQDDLVKYVLTDLKNGDVFFTLGAGDIYKLHDSLSA